MQVEKLVIIGSGPAGYTAAIYAARAGLDPILYKGPEPGGQLVSTTQVENFPGFPTGVLGAELMKHFEDQAIRFETRISNSIVSQVDFSEYPYRLVSNLGTDTFAKSIIVATGSSAKWLGLPSEQRLSGKGVSACAICDGFFFRNQDVAVVGGGDTAAEEALYLAKLCKKVYLLVRSSGMRASQIMQARVIAETKVQILFNTIIDEIIGQDEVEKICILDVNYNQKRYLNVQGVFIAIGHTPNTKIFKNFLSLDDKGYIKTLPGSTITNMKGVFAAGDVQDSRYRQAITAAGSGCMAALDAERFLSEN